MYLPIHLIKRADEAPAKDAAEAAKGGSEETEWSSYGTSLSLCSCPSHVRSGCSLAPAPTQCGRGASPDIAVTYGACALAASILLAYIYWRWRVLHNPARSSWRQGKCLCVECNKAINAQAEAGQRLCAKGIKRTELEEDDWRQQAANTTATVPNLFWGRRTYRHAECAEKVRKETLGR